MKHRDQTTYCPNCRPDDDVEIDWMWGETRPAMDRVVVPGVCPTCGQAYDRIYGIKHIEER